MIISLADVPYLKHCPSDGRIRPLVTFYDWEIEKWTTYILRDENQVLCLSAERLMNGIYLSSKAQDPTKDVEVPLLTFLFQHLPNRATFGAFDRLNSDLQNSLSVIQKQKILFNSYRVEGDIGISALVSTDIEYALLNHRSSYDLLNRFMMEFLRQHAPKRPALKDSFAQVCKHPVEKLIADFEFPAPMAAFYASRRDVFMELRELRNGIAHHGADPGTVYCLPDGFGIDAGSHIAKGLKKGVLWNRLNPRENDIASCLAFVAVLAKDIAVALEGFTDALAASMGPLPPMTSPGLHIYSRLRYGHLLSRLDEMINNPWDMNFYSAQV